MRAHDLGVKAGDSVRGLRRHVELNVTDAQRDRTETSIRLVAAILVAPRAGRFDEGFIFMEVEAGAVELFARLAQPLQQRAAIRYHESGVAAQHLRFAARQMELAAPDVDPHVARSGHK